MSGKRDSNPRPSAWEANALPTELLPQNVKIIYKYTDNLRFSKRLNWKITLTIKQTQLSLLYDI